MNQEFSGKKILIVGGAGFVGSNLSHMVLESDIASLTIVDNFLSSDIVNVPKDERVELITGSIADDSVLGQLATGID